MMRRSFWFATGVAIGAGGTLWAEQRLRRRVRQATSRLSPDRVVLETIEGARRLGDRVSGAVAAGRQARAERELALREELGRRVGVPAGPTRNVPERRRGEAASPVGSPGWTASR
jgi:hypothetical protein